MDYSLYQKNITEFAAIPIPKVHAPKDLYQLKAILIEANESKSPVYPISTGHNWGLGSKLPVVASELIDLSGMNQIIEINEDLSYARIQPGVTQKQLCKALQAEAPHLMLNVTGGDAGSSVLANALERGSGKNGHKAQDIRQLKVMLADGQEISTGLGGIAPDAPSFYQYGLGPDLTHLFTQSNFGVITEGVINLRHKQPFVLYLIRFDKVQMGRLLQTMADLVRKEVVGNSLELDSSNDPKIHELFTEGSTSDSTWVGWFAIFGCREMLQVKKQLVEEALGDCVAEITSFYVAYNHENSPIPVQVRIDRYNGRPNDHSLTASAKAFGVDISGAEGTLDIDLYEEMPGFRCVLPVLPFSHSAADHIAFIEDFSKQRSQNPSISVIGLNAYSLEVFARVYFDRKDPRQVRKASQWSEELLDGLKRRGVYPYRLDVENMQPYLSTLNDQTMGIKRQIKDVFDPNHIIAPKRYLI